MQLTYANRMILVYFSLGTLQAQANICKVRIARGTVWGAGCCRRV